MLDKVWPRSWVHPLKSWTTFDATDYLSRICSVYTDTDPEFAGSVNPIPTQSYFMPKGPISKFYKTDVKFGIGIPNRRIRYTDTDTGDSAVGNTDTVPNSKRPYRTITKIQSSGILMVSRASAWAISNKISILEEKADSFAFCAADVLFAFFLRSRQVSNSASSFAWQCWGALVGILALFHNSDAFSIAKLMPLWLFCHSLCVHEWRGQALVLGKAISLQSKSL